MSVLRPALGTLLLSASLFIPRLILAAENHSGEAAPNLNCDMAEQCFRVAIRKDRSESMVPRDQQLASKVERLRMVTEQHPGSLWARRAGLLTGVLLVKTDPAVAMRYLRASQRDFPVLDDYIRLWMGEALLKSGDAAQAAAMFESIPQMVPDTNVAGLAAFRAGEAWYQASSCSYAHEWLAKALALNDKEAAAPYALLRLADCHLRENRLAEARASLKQIWIRYPHAIEATESQAKLIAGLGGESWSPSPDDLYARAQAFLALSLHPEAVEELRKFLAAAPHHPRRQEARLKLGVSLVRLKQYDQAKEVFRSLVIDRIGESNEASVWLARIHLRQGQGDKLLELAHSIAQSSSLTPEQKANIHIFAGIWLEDQGRFDDALAQYRQVVKWGEPPSQRVEALWRIGWVQYRAGRFHEAIHTWQTVVDARDSVFEPQALYWMGRAFERDKAEKAKDLYVRLCQKHVYTYYCQLARPRAEIPSPAPGIEVLVAEDVEKFPPNRRAEIERETAYRRAAELKVLGMDQDASRELAVLTERYSRDQDVLLALSTMLNETGAYHQALRLARLHFRDRLERSGGPVAPSLWRVAYPTALLPTIRSQGIEGVDPYLVAAIIREESQYDGRAVSRVGAIGLMQVMPATANAVAQRWGFPAVVREDLFDQDTNIRIGVRYLRQLLEQFSGNMMYAVAAYNAGPVVVNTWISANSDRDVEEFVELIPYQETRLYVKRVLRSYREYLRLGSSTLP
ncbi:MAG: transglycosylase SLT domain-containing protein [Nitrospiraceae bacterium]